MTPVVWASLCQNDMKWSLLNSRPIFMRNESSNLFSSVLSIVMKKHTCYQPFRTRHFVRVCTEKTVDHQYRENGVRNIFKGSSDESLLWMLSKSIKTLFVIYNSIEQFAKLWRFLKYSRWSCVWILPAYLNLTLSAHTNLVWQCQSTLKRGFPLFYVLM